MYEKNREVLKQVVAEGAAIRHVSKHHLPDGSTDVEGNLTQWRGLMERFETIPLWENGAPGFDDRAPLQLEPSIVFYPAPDNTAPRGCIVIAPGGAFVTLTACEGFNVAKYFNDMGFAVATLSYRLNPYTRFDAIDDMKRAIRLLRYRKDELGLSGKIAAMGFSAGGMVSANTATNFDLGDPDAADPIERISCRPDAAVIGYGSLSTLERTWGFSGYHGPEAELPIEQRWLLSVEKRVTPNTPPFFIWQTLSDDGRNGMSAAKALQDMEVPYELHIFTTGLHGCAMGDGQNDLYMTDEHVAHWGPMCCEWLAHFGFEK